MATATLALPTGETLRFVFLRRWEDLGDMVYLQSIRSGRLDDNSLTAQTYKNMAPIYAGRLADAVGTGAPGFDTVVAPPSRRSDAAIYRNVIVKRTGTRDLTDGFSRKGKVSAATASSVQEIADEFEYRPLGGESEIRSLIVVDESVASGRTIAAVLDHLRRAGLANDCQITVAAAAWLAKA